MTTALETSVRTDSAPAVGSTALLGVVVETAKIYKANGRRFFTKRAACRALAKQIINERCECEPDHRWGDGSCDLTPGMTCWYHKDADRLEKIIRRMARIIMHAKTPNVLREPSGTDGSRLK